MVELPDDARVTAARRRFLRSLSTYEGLAVAERSLADFERTLAARVRAEAEKGTAQAEATGEPNDLVTTLTAESDEVDETAVAEAVAAERRRLSDVILPDHWQTMQLWGGVRRLACGRCSYSDGVRFLWPCPTRRAITGEPEPEADSSRLAAGSVPVAERADTHRRLLEQDCVSHLDQEGRTVSMELTVPALRARDEAIRAQAVAAERQRAADELREVERKAAVAGNWTLYDFVREVRLIREGWAASPVPVATSDASPIQQHSAECGSPGQCTNLRCRCACHFEGIGSVATSEPWSPFRNRVDWLRDQHARYHDQPGNMLGRDECGWEPCRFWDGAEWMLGAGSFGPVATPTEPALAEDDFIDMARRVLAGRGIEVARSDVGRVYDELRKRAAATSTEPARCWCRGAMFVSHQLGATDCDGAASPVPAKQPPTCEHGEGCRRLTTNPGDRPDCGRCPDRESDGMNW